MARKDRGGGKNLRRLGSAGVARIGISTRCAVRPFRLARIAAPMPQEPVESLNIRDEVSHSNRTKKLIMSAKDVLA